MLTSRSRLAFVSLAVLFAALAASAATAPPRAEAAHSAYCNNQYLPVGVPGNMCWGAPRTMYQLMGWGDHAAVCISMGGSAGGHGAFYSCSAGKGWGVYTPTFGPFYATPMISNYGSVKNLVHGVVYQP
jgi:hypothetical protein